MTDFHQLSSKKKTNEEHNKWYQLDLIYCMPCTPAVYTVQRQPHMIRNVSISLKKKNELENRRKKITHPDEECPGSLFFLKKKGDIQLERKRKKKRIIRKKSKLSDRSDLLGSWNEEHQLISRKVLYVFIVDDWGLLYLILANLKNWQNFWTVSLTNLFTPPMIT